MPLLFDANSLAARLARLWPFARRAGRLRKILPDRSKSAARVEASFNTVFAMMPANRRQGLIRYYQDKHGCDRIAAMKRAIEDRNGDDARWM